MAIKNIHKMHTLVWAVSSVLWKVKTRRESGMGTTNKPEVPCEDSIV